MDSANQVDVRCSAIVFRHHQILLVRRDRPGGVDWVLPGGTPKQAESVASCTRREVAEETGLLVTVQRVAFVLEAANSTDGVHLLDLVFTAVEADPTTAPCAIEPGLTPIFCPVAEIASLRLRPPIAGYLRGLHATGGRGGGAYLGNVWRPASLPDSAAAADVVATTAGRWHSVR